LHPALEEPNGLTGADRIHSIHNALDLGRLTPKGLSGEASGDDEDDVSYLTDKEHLEVLDLLQPIDNHEITIGRYVGNEIARERRLIEVTYSKIDSPHVKCKDVREGNQQEGWRNRDEEQKPKVTGNMAELLASDDPQPADGHV
jgi:hypothetical protein